MRFFQLSRSNVRQGFSIPVAILAGGFLLIIAGALSFYSQGEMKSVRTLLGKTTSEYVSFSGLIWAYERLCRKGRWYQPAGNSFDDRGNQWCNSWEGAPFGDTIDSIAIPFSDDQAKKVTIFIDEVKSSRTRQIPGKTINGKQGLEMLDHLKVLALGEAGGEDCLIFGKLIMMPEPILNSNMLTGQFPDDPVDQDPDKYVIRVPEIRNKPTGYGAKIEPGYIWSQDFELTDRVQISQVFFAKGQRVRMEDYVVQFHTEWTPPPTWATQEPKMRARYDGVVDDVLVGVGDIKNEGDPLAVIRKNHVRRGTKIPLIKMVRITRIPTEIYRGRKLSDVNNRIRVYKYIDGLKESFLKNFLSSSDSSSLDAFFSGLNAVSRVPVLTDDQIARIPNLAAPDGANKNEAMNYFVRNMMYNFVAPIGLVATAAKQFGGSAQYELAVEPREITPQLKELLEIHGQHYHGSKDFFTNQMDTLPKKMLRQGKDVYKFKSEKYDGATQEYIDFMMNRGRYGFKNPDPGGKNDAFIHDASWLDDAAVYANIYLNQDTPWTPETFDNMVKNGEIKDPENYFRWKNSKGEEGYWKFAPESAITIRKISVPYNYVNPVIPGGGTPNPNEDPTFAKDQAAFTVRECDLMDFFRKHYDEGNVSPGAGELRPDDDIEDTPQAPGPPDATGCSFSGVSS